MSENVVSEASKDAETLARRIRPDDYATLKRYYDKKSFSMIAFMLRRYGIEFKGVTHLEVLVNKLIKMKEQK